MTLDTCPSGLLPSAGIWRPLWHNPTMSGSIPNAPPIQSSRSLRDRVDEILPGWQSWYPSLFDAAQDLGILRAQVCDLSSLMLSHRHANIYNEAVQAFRNQWSVEEPENQDDDSEGDFSQDHHDFPDSEPDGDKPSTKPIA